MGENGDSLRWDLTPKPGRKLPLAAPTERLGGYFLKTAGAVVALMAGLGGIGWWWAERTLVTREEYRDARELDAHHQGALNETLRQIHGTMSRQETTLGEINRELVNVKIRLGPERRPR